MFESMYIKRLFYLVFAILFLIADIQANTVVCLNETYEQEAFDFSRTRNFAVTRVEVQKPLTSFLTDTFCCKPERLEKGNFIINQNVKSVQSLTILYRVFRL